MGENGVDLDGRGDVGVFLAAEHVERPHRVDEAGALRVRRDVVHEPRGRGQRRPQHRRVGTLAVQRLVGAHQQRARARGLRGGHRRAVQHAVARGQLVRARHGAARLPPRRGRHRGARGDEVGLEPAVLPRPARRERVQALLGRGLGTVVGEPRGLADVGADAQGVGCHGRVTHGVRPGAAVACRDEQLHVVGVDDPVVQLGASVVAVVQGRQAADRDVDDVGAVLGRVDDAVHQAARRARRGRQAGLHRHQLRAGSRAVHLAAEQVVARGDARDVRAVRARGQADVDVARLVGLHDERHTVDDLGVRVVLAEEADVVVDLVVPHRLLVGEVAVTVEVDADLHRRGVDQHAPAVLAVAVAVDVTFQLAAAGAEVLGGLVEHAEGELAFRRGPLAALRRERARVGLLRQPHPRAVAGVGGVGRVPVDDLALAGAGLGQRRVVEVDTAVEDRDGGAAAVPEREQLAEPGGLGVLRRQVRVALGCRGVRCGLREGVGHAERLGLVPGDQPVDVDGLHRTELLRLLCRRERHRDLQVVEVGVRLLHPAAQRGQLALGGRRLAGFGGDEQCDGGPALLLGLFQQDLVLVVELLTGLRLRRDLLLLARSLGHPEPQHRDGAHRRGDAYPSHPRLSCH